jgi:hypothetical protein
VVPGEGATHDSEIGGFESSARFFQVSSVSSNLEVIPEGRELLPGHANTHALAPKQPVSAISFLDSCRSTLEFARVFELPEEQVAVVLPAKLTVVYSGAIITEMRLKLPWSDCLLEVGDPRNHRFFPDVTQDWPGTLKILNDWLVDREVPLRTCQRSGLIVGTGWAPVPAAYPADREVQIELSLYDQRDNVMRFEFKARLDRRIARTSMVRRASLLRNASIASKSAGLFEPAKYPRTATEEISVLHPRGVRREPRPSQV